MKQYPAIYKSEDKSIYLYSDKGNYYCFTREFWDESEDMDNHESDTNITREYLSNTRGEVESKEHAEFIVELAKLHGFSVFMPIGSVNHFIIKDGLSFHNCEKIKSTDLKQITIPLPPKVEVSEAGHNLVFAASECKEWPCVNNEVTWGNKVCSGIIKAIDGNLAWIKNEYGNYVTEYIDKLQKPKTPEEALRDEVTEVIWKANEQWGNSKGERQISVQEFVAIALLTKYNITPKD